MSKVTVSFEMEKDTKNTIRFKEVVPGPLDTPKVGTVYVPKITLKEIGYEVGKNLQMDLYVK
jgi:hypothetical protein